MNSTRLSNSVPSPLALHLRPVHGVPGEQAQRLFPHALQVRRHGRDIVQPFRSLLPGQAQRPAPARPKPLDPPFAAPLRPELEARSRPAARDRRADRLQAGPEAVVGLQRQLHPRGPAALGPARLRHRRLRASRPRRGGRLQAQPHSPPVRAQHRVRADQGQGEDRPGRPQRPQLRRHRGDGQRNRNARGRQRHTPGRGVDHRPHPPTPRSHPPCFRETGVPARQPWPRPSPGRAGQRVSPRRLHPVDHGPKRRVGRAPLDLRRG